MHLVEKLHLIDAIPESKKKRGRSSVRRYLQLLSVVTFFMCTANCYKKPSHSLSTFDMWTFNGDSLIKPEAVVIQEIYTCGNEYAVMIREFGLVEKYTRRITSTGEYRKEEGDKMQLYFPFKSQSAIVFKRKTGRDYEIQLMATKFYLINNHRYQLNQYSVIVGGTGKVVYYCVGIGIIGYTSFAANANFLLNHYDKYPNQLVRQMVAQVKSDADFFYPLRLKHMLKDM